MLFVSLLPPPLNGLSKELVGWTSDVAVARFCVAVVLRQRTAGRCVRERERNAAREQVVSAAITVVVAKIFVVAELDVR
jgi:hypothetical protein